MKGEMIVSTETQKRTTLVLNPEEQTRNPLLDDIPVMQSVVSSGEPKGYSAGYNGLIN